MVCDKLEALPCAPAMGAWMMGRSMPSEGTTTRVGRASPVVVGMRVESAVGWAVGEGDVPGIGLKYGSVGGVQTGYEGVGAPLPMGVGVAHGWIVADAIEPIASLDAAAGSQAAQSFAGRVMPVAELGVPGAHNVSNALAAVAVALLPQPQQRELQQR